MRQLKEKKHQSKENKKCILSQKDRDTRERKKESGRERRVGQTSTGCGWPTCLLVANYRYKRPDRPPSPSLA